MKHDDPDNQRRIRFWIQTAGKTAATIVFIYLLAVLGLRADYWQGYAIIAYTVILMVVVRIIFRNRLGVLRERMSPGEGIKGWDRIFWFFYNLFSVVFFFVAILDGGKYHWSGELPWFVYVLTYAVLIASTALVIWPMYVNPFFSTRVRIQKDRGHHVITDGPYKFVRHPGYLAVFFLYPSFSFALGSIWSLPIVAVIIVTVIIRTYLEDKTLRRELPGYEEYAKMVKYRLIPGIW